MGDLPKMLDGEEARFDPLAVMKRDPDLAGLSDAKLERILLKMWVFVHGLASLMQTASSAIYRMRKSGNCFMRPVRRSSSIPSMRMGNALEIHEVPEASGPINYFLSFMPCSGVRLHRGGD